jgi:dTMP kinase
VAATAPGRLVTFEGGEGAGKTTQIAGAATWLESRGLPVLRTREPGGTEGAEAIRRLLLEGGADRWTPLGELLLVAAARAEHLARVVEPALAAGVWVLCDRYLDSTRVYQGLAGGLGLGLVDRLQGEVLGFRVPDLTLVLDLPVEEGLARRRAAGAASRFERKGAEFHERVREGFRALARAEPGRLALVDASRPAEEVAREIRTLLAGRLGLGP